MSTIVDYKFGAHWKLVRFMTKLYGIYVLRPTLLHHRLQRSSFKHGISRVKKENYYYTIQRIVYNTLFTFFIVWISLYFSLYLDLPIIFLCSCFCKPLYLDVKRSITSSPSSSPLFIADCFRFFESTLCSPLRVSFFVYVVQTFFQ